MNKKLISVVMSTYNTDEKYLKKAVESILKQTYQLFEFIIVIDGVCKDGEIIEEYKDERIKILYNDENMGLPYSLNKAIDFSNGEYIARMDSDDISIDSRLKCQLEYMEKNNEIMITGMYANMIGDMTGTIGLEFIKKEELYIQLLYRSIFTHPTVMINKKYLQENTYKYNEKYLCAQDYELWTRISTPQNIAIIPKVGLLYRVHSKQISSRKQELQKEYSEIIFRKNLKNAQIEENEENVWLLMVLGGKQNIKENDIGKLCKIVEKLRKYEHGYNEKNFKKILYNRVFVIICMNKLFNFKNINKYSLYKYILNVANLYYILQKVKRKILIK